MVFTVGDAGIELLPNGTSLKAQPPCAPKDASRLRGSLSPRWPAEMNGVPMRLLIYALSLLVVSGGAYAQSDPLPKSAKLSDAARIAAMYSQCLNDWDSGTHLTKQAWERSNCSEGRSGTPDRQAGSVALNVWSLDGAIGQASRTRRKSWPRGRL